MNNLKATKRETITSGQLNKLRDSGFIPGILYGGKDPNAKISVEKKLIKNILNSESFLSSVLDLDLDGDKFKVIPRDVAYNVISDEPIHIDFMRVVPGTKIILEIPVKFINNSDCPGLKVGGVLTGEHGVGIEKRELMCEMFNNNDIQQQIKIKKALDSSSLLNPGKVYPILRKCAEEGRVHVHKGKTKFPNIPRF